MAAADARAIATLHFGGLGRDALRGAALTAAGLAVAMLLRRMTLPAQVPPLLLAAAIGSGLAAVVNGAVRSTGKGRRLAWLVAGVGVGAMLSLVAGAVR